jgi:hypothetical protein
MAEEYLCIVGYVESAISRVILSRLIILNRPTGEKMK